MDSFIAKKIKKEDKCPYIKITKHSLTSDVWNSNIGRKFLNQNHK